MILASIGHDDIQYWLSIKENRDKVLDILGFKWNDLPLSHYSSSITKEDRRKPAYEPEIFIDIFEARKVGDYRSAYVIWEIKPVVANLGEILRQLRKYRQIMACILNRTEDYFHTILVYNTSSIKNGIIKQYFEPENVNVYQVSALECPRLEERILEVCDD